MAVDTTLTRARFLRATAAALAVAATRRLSMAADAPPALPRLNTRTIPSSGAALPVIGCGTWMTFDVGTAPAERDPLAATLRALFDAGGSVIDSSPMYGNSEQVVGDLLTDGMRERAFIATKVWTRGRDAGIAQMQNSMQKLRTEHVDLMQVHNLVDWREHLPTLREWKAAGRIRYIGITHYTRGAYAEVEAVMRAEKLDFVQINYALDERAAEERILPLAAERGVAVIVNRPFSAGALFRKVQGTPMPGWARELQCTTWSQVFLKFVLSHPAVTCTVPGMSTPAHVAENMVAGFGPLPDARQRARIAQQWDAQSG